MPGAPTSLPTSVLIDDVRIPTLVYGTAWKEERTEGLVAAALAAGFRGIDTANQRKHYHEAGVGAALKAAFASGAVAREDLFIQTKFTFLRGQDHRLPYDADAPLAKQVEQSFASSMEHLGVDRLDAYLLHGPSTHGGLADADVETWRAMESLHDSGRVSLLGISNVALDQLETLHARARVKPMVVQNRSFTRPRADAGVRAFCREHGMAYEGFSLLTAIPHVVGSLVVGKIAARTGHTPAEIILHSCIAEGMVVLTGTSSSVHMTQDVSVTDFALATEEMAAIRALIT